MDVRRRHLIEEAKAELDVAYEEVKRVENKLIELERDYGMQIAEAERVNGAEMPAKIAALVFARDEKKVSIDVSTAYMIEKAALDRFSIITATFSTVCVHPDADRAADKLEAIVFRPGELKTLGTEVKDAVRDFADGLRAYTTIEATVENDQKVRKSWAVIEDSLCGFGRAI